jgi:hypothetical protein
MEMAAFPFDAMRDDARLSFHPPPELTRIIPIIAPCGSPFGSNTSANSAIGAVPSGWTIDAVTMKK